MGHLELLDLYADHRTAELRKLLGEASRVLIRCEGVMSEVEQHERRTFFTHTKQDVREVLAEIRKAVNDGNT